MKTFNITYLVNNSRYVTQVKAKTCIIAIKKLMELVGNKSLNVVKINLLSMGK